MKHIHANDNAPTMCVPNSDLDEKAGQHKGFEIFFCDWRALGEDLDTGWYWWAGQPGCLPDGDPVGPFYTSTEAYDDYHAGLDQ